MTPENEQDTQERLMQEAVCGLVGHKYEEIKMPSDWEHFSGAVSCKFCPHSTVIEIDRTELEV